MRPVWVIDDDRSIRWVFEKALAREGIPFKTFAQATEAMEALDATGAPQVLVSDIRMPGTSGLDLLQNVKQRFPDLPGPGSAPVPGARRSGALLLCLFRHWSRVEGLAEMQATLLWAARYVGG